MSSESSSASAVVQPSSEKPYSMVPPSTLASQALINEDAGGVKMQSPFAGNSSTESQQASSSIPALARRSSHNYENDLAKYASYSGGESKISEEKTPERLENSRRKSFAREDMKRAQFLAMEQQAANSGFSEK